MTFEDFNLKPQLQEGVASFGYDAPTEIQSAVIPEAMRGADILACSKTGSGKTVAFLVPIMQQILDIDTPHNKALILTPTREICMQVEEQIEGLAYFADLSSIAVYGGSDQDGFANQRNAFVSGADIIVATPGRLKAHINLGYVNFDHLRFLVLDEADEMLDMGFYQDVIDIIKIVPKQRQTLMFSATMPNAIKQLADEILTQPTVIDINKSKPAEEINQSAYLVGGDKKKLFLKSLIHKHLKHKVIVFVSKKDSVLPVATYLKRSGVNCMSINSSFSQDERIAIVRAFKAAKAAVLVTTNLLSRGIDIDDVHLIVNYEIPQKPEDYIHRIGRTARAGKTGQAISLIDERDIPYFFRIEKLIGKTVDKMPLPDKFGKSPEYKLINNKRRHQHARNQHRKPNNGKQHSQSNVKS